MGRNEEAGSALGAMLIVLTLIAILTAGVARLVALRVVPARQAVHRLQAQYAAESGLDHLRHILSQPGGFAGLLMPEDTLQWTLTDTVSATSAYAVTYRPYGGYIEAISTGVCHKESVTVRILLGMKPPGWFARAITLQAGAYPLVLTGKSRIAGDVMAGPGGVRTGRIPGEPMPAKEPDIQGTVLTQGEEASFDPTLFEQTMTALDRHLEDQGSAHGTDALTAFGERLSPRAFPDSLTGGVVFLPGTLVQITAGPDDPPLTGPITLVARGEIRLQGDLRLTGPVTIVAKDSIRALDRTRIQGGLLYSPGPIRLMDEAELEGQALSRHLVEVRDHARVRYPGVLYATGKRSEGRIDGGVTITSDALQRGSLIARSRLDRMSGPALDRVRVKIDTKGRVAGMVYSASHTWLAGEMTGSVACGAFYLEHGPTTYINWIKDGIIDRTGLSEAFLLPLFFDAAPQPAIVSWEWLKR